MEEDVLNTQQPPETHALDICDLCGRPIDRTASRRLTLDRFAADSADTLVVCDACFKVAETSDLPYDVVIGAAIEAADE